MTHAAQNPTDWKHVHFGFAKPGSIVGCDFAGEVVEVGKEAIGQYLDVLSFSYIVPFSFMEQDLKCVLKYIVRKLDSSPSRTYF